MNANKKTRVVECTQAAFDRLPALVTLQEFLDWTGYNKADLLAEVRAGRMEVYRPQGRTKGKYFKRVIARIGGYKL